MDEKADSARELCSHIETSLLGRIRLPVIEGTYYSRSADFGERGLTVFTMTDLPTGRKWFCRLVNNYFVLLNLYVLLAGFPMEAIIGMAAKVNPKVADKETLIIWAFVPFNLFKGTVVSLLTLLIYKPISKLIHKSPHISETEPEI